MRRISEDTVDIAHHAQANMMIHGYMAHSAVFIEQTQLMFLCIKIYHSNDLPGVWPRRYVIVRGTMWTLIHVRTEDREVWTELRDSAGSHNNKHY